MNTVLIGVGNRLRGDDGVGPAVVSDVAGRQLAGVEVVVVADPHALLEAWQGARLAVVVDAARTGAPPGQVRRWSAAGLPERAVSSHAFGIREVCALGAALDRLPAELVVVTVEVADTAFGERLSGVVAAAVPEAVALVIELLERGALAQRPHEAPYSPHRA